MSVFVEFCKFRSTLEVNYVYGHPDDAIVAIGGFIICMILMIAIFVSETSEPKSYQKQDKQVQQARTTE